MGGLLAIIYHNLGLGAEDVGSLAEAREWYVQSIPHTVQSGFRWIGPYALEGFATLAVREGDARRCVVLAGAAAAAREQMGTPIPPFMQERLDRALGPARGQLADLAETAWAQGQRKTLEQAIDYAMEAADA
jgi:hypothetical protein